MLGYRVSKGEHNCRLLNKTARTPGAASMGAAFRCDCPPGVLIYFCAVDSVTGAADFKVSYISRVKL